MNISTPQHLLLEPERLRPVLTAITARQRFITGCTPKTQTPPRAFWRAQKGQLENRVWYDYAGQSGGAYQLATIICPRIWAGCWMMVRPNYTPTLITRFGHLTNSIDPLGRTFSYLYDTNGIDLLEIRQTRAGNNELLFRATYNSQHRPLTMTDAAGQTNTFTYNARSQLLTATDPKNETTTFTYDANGYLIAVDGPLPGTNDTSHGRL